MIHSHTLIHQAHVERERETIAVAVYSGPRSVLSDWDIDDIDRYRYRYRYDIDIDTDADDDIDIDIDDIDRYRYRYTLWLIFTKSGDFPAPSTTPHSMLVVEDTMLEDSLSKLPGLLPPHCWTSLGFALSWREPLTQGHTSSQGLPHSITYQRGREYKGQPPCPNPAQPWMAIPAPELPWDWLEPSSSICVPCFLPFSHCMNPESTP